MGQRRTSNLLRPWWDVVYVNLLRLIVVINTVSLVYVILGHGPDEPLHWPSSSEVNIIENANNSHHSFPNLDNNENKEKKLNKTSMLDVLVSRVSEDEHAFRTTLAETAKETTYASIAALMAFALIIILTLIVNEAIFDRLFYGHMTVETLAKLTMQLASVQSSSLSSSQLMATTLYLSNSNLSLPTLLRSRDLIRIILLLPLIILTIILLVLDEDKVSSIMTYCQLLLMALELIIAILIGLWSMVFKSRSDWGQLMRIYGQIVLAMDVSRGRVVPVIIDDNRCERVMSNSNPYEANSDVALVLDLVALRNTGLALRALAYIETDVYINWRPFNAEISDNYVIKWTDPMAIQYLVHKHCYSGQSDEMGLIRRLRIYYAIQVEDRVRLIGFDDARYENVTKNNEIKMKSKNNENMLYHYKLCSEEVNLIQSNMANINVWTVVDGQMVARIEIRVNYPLTKEKNGENNVNRFRKNYSNNELTVESARIYGRKNLKKRVVNTPSPSSLSLASMANEDEEKKGNNDNNEEAEKNEENDDESFDKNFYDSNELNDIDDNTQQKVKKESNNDHNERNKVKVVNDRRASLFSTEETMKLKRSKRSRSLENVHYERSASVNVEESNTFYFDNEAFKGSEEELEHLDKSFFLI